VEVEPVGEFDQRCAREEEIFFDKSPTAARPDKENQLTRFRPAIFSFSKANIYFHIIFIK
jgi:hypothetical protein